MSVVDFEVHLDQSENIELDGQEHSDELKTINKILPFQMKEVARVVLKNNWKLKSKFKLTMNVPEKSIQYTYIQKDEKDLQIKIKKNYNFYKALNLSNLSKEEIEREFNKKGVNFIDISFPPSDDSMVNVRYGEHLKDLFDYIVHWRRAEDFCLESINNNNNDENKEIKIFNYNEPEPNDIQQGILPDTHLASALSALAEKYNLIRRLFKSEEFSKCGFYQVKLCLSGEWTSVYVDDYFPCIPLSNPLVSRSLSNELWVLILEKALAKVLESYYALISVNISDFFLMLTGCPTLYLNLEDLVKFEGQENCLNKIKNYVLDKKYIVVAIAKTNLNEQQENDSEYEDENLTISNFGYTVLDLKTKFNDFIVLRKVWYDQKKEEKIQKYQEELKDRNPALASEINEGTLILRKLNFYKILAFEIFLNEFSSISVCYAKNWDEVRIRGKFVSITVNF